MDSFHERVTYYLVKTSPWMHHRSQMMNLRLLWDAFICDLALYQWLWFPNNNEPRASSQTPYWWEKFQPITFACQNLSLLSGHTLSPVFCVSRSETTFVLVFFIPNTFKGQHDISYSNNLKNKWAIFFSQEAKKYSFFAVAREILVT